MSDNRAEFQDMLRQLEAICNYPEDAIKTAKAYMDGMIAGAQIEAAKNGEGKSNGSDAE